MNAGEILRDPGYSDLKRHVIDSTGLVYYADKDPDLAERLRNRMDALQLSACSSYLQILKGGTGGAVELDVLIEQLTIGETYFFRHREQFDALREIIIPKLIERNQASRRIRIWCAGCSIGAEPYSIAILLKREFATELLGWDVSVLGTDINRKFLETARAGCFDEWAFRSTEPWLRADYFKPLGKTWIIDPGIRASVQFQYHNLLKHPFPSLINNLAALDLIICRNVMIYFDAETYQKVVSNFEESLVDEGWMIVGHAEARPGGFKGMKTIQLPSVTLYQKCKDADSERSLLPFEFNVPFLPFTAAPNSPDHLITGFKTPSLPAVPRTVSMTGDATPPADLAHIRALADRGAFAEALQHCGRMIKKDRLNPKLYFLQGLVLEQLGNHDESEHVLKQALFLDRDFVLAHYYLALLYQRQKNPVAAHRHFKASLQLLANLDDGLTFADAEGISVRELRIMVNMNLGVS
jgi:chemotaxis protein methyltransferase CheR